MGGVGGIVVSAHDYGSQGPGFEPAIRRFFYYSYHQPTLVRGSSITSTDLRRKTRMSERLRNRRRRHWLLSCDVESKGKLSHYNSQGIATNRKLLLSYQSEDLCIRKKKKKRRRYSEI